MSHRAPRPGGLRHRTKHPEIWPQSRVPETPSLGQLLTFVNREMGLRHLPTGEKAGWCWQGPATSKNDEWPQGPSTSVRTQEGQNRAEP